MLERSANPEASTLPVNRFAAFGQLGYDELAFLYAMPDPAVPFGAREVIRRDGDPNRGVFVLHEGWAVSSVELADGSRQIVKVHLPGDILGAPSLPYATAVETLSTLTAARVSEVPHDKLGEAFVRVPRLAALMFLASQEERVFLMDRLATVGRVGGTGSVAALLVHLHDRLALLGPLASTHIEIPLTQAELGDILGLTAVHVNRVLGAMEKAGHLRRHGRIFDLVDVERLRTLAGVPRRRVARDLNWLPQSG